MNKDEYFGFEEEGFDFPFYKDKKFLTKKSGILSILSVLAFIFLILGPIRFQNNQEQFILLFVMLIPLLVALNGNLGVFFRKPIKSDIKVIIKGFLGSFLLVFVIVSILTFLGLIFSMDLNSLTQTASNTQGQTLDLLNIILQLIQIFGEELFRAVIFILTLFITYKITNNRKKSIIVGILVALLMFGLMHTNSYNNLLYNILYMGFASFFEFYPYIKTKNLLLSVIVHFLYNLTLLIIFSLV